MHITISSVTIPNWQGTSDSVSLLIYINGAFTAETGTLYPLTVSTGLPYGGHQSVGTFYQSFPCTVSSGTLTIPSITIDSTTDSPDNPAATYSAVLWDTTVGIPIQMFGTLAAWSLNSSPTSTTWAAIFTAEAYL